MTKVGFKETVKEFLDMEVICLF